MGGAVMVLSYALIALIGAVAAYAFLAAFGWEL